ncbi:N-acetylglutamate synthase [Salmonella enterica subsp. enterica serovar Urbana str. R8-2977]|uniref:Amino-acid acetyltransferase n=1 Tax=Salmonella enterica subsp. enterica serovar Urbana str. R8-2977 TaxID=913084 RepID=G5S017_SALET|nr:N-acetylglutamate synthase [Salmonella enterica subsp. enterica serovar Urbana str. R8-2977]
MGRAMIKERKTELVEGFRHSVPYINTHRGKTFVIMLGGEAIEHDNFSSIVSDIGLLHSLGIRLVVVYGARPQIDANLAAHHHEPIYHKNTRVTDAKALELVKQAAGLLQLDITARLSMSLNNTPLQGAHINVVSGNFTIAQPLGVDDGVDYCHSGRIRRIDEDAINRQLDNGAIVLMGPVAVSVTGESFNLTSEEIATQLAVKLKAEKMIGFCSSQGVTNSEGGIISELFPNEAQARVEELEALGDYNSGTVRFLRGAVITAWAERFRQRLSSLWFVEEEINDDDCRAEWQLLGKTWQGWWQNQWQLWGQGHNRKMVCSLTCSHLEQGVAVNLAASRRFVTWLWQQPEFQQSAHYSAKRVTQILYLLTEKYNSQWNHI